MDPHARVLVVIEPGALQLAVIHPEAQRFDEIELSGRVRGEPDHVAGIRRNFGVDENDGEHWVERRALSGERNTSRRCRSRACRRLR